MMQAHTCVNNHNPVWKNRKNLSKQQVAQILIQYTFLVRWIISFLSIATVRLNQYPKIQQDLLKNVGEESGSRTHGKSHQSILFDCLRHELTIDVTGSRQDTATQEFLESIQNALIHKSTAFAAGVIYALEASAVPELTVVARLINLCKKGVIHIQLLTNPVRAYKAAKQEHYNLEDFFVLHTVQFEKGHESGLRLAIQKELPAGAEAEFEEGFEFLLTLMDDWWQALATAPQPAKQ
jgi:hypothetical protein